jgi:hypothetical protein
MLKLVSGNPYSQIASLSGERSSLETPVYDCRYIERLAFALQGRGGGLIEIFVSDNGQDWVQAGRIEGQDSFSVEAQLFYLPRFVKARLTRKDSNLNALALIQISPLTPEVSREFGTELFNAH